MVRAVKVNPIHFSNCIRSASSGIVIPYYVLLPMPTSRLTQKRQATIPKDICAFLDLDSGDVVQFAVEGDKVVLRKASAFDAAFHRSLGSTLSDEWSSKLDSQAYDAL